MEGTEGTTDPKIDTMSSSLHSADSEAILITQVPSEIRCFIYGFILKETGTQHHIFCPSVAPSRKPNEPQSHYLLSNKYTAADSKPACGHFRCQETLDHPTSTNDFSLADLVSLMTVNKLIYREVSHFLYSSTTFVFASFPELGAFLDRISPQLLPSIRSVTFIAHLIPYNEEIRRNQAQGDYFRGTGWDHVSLFKRMPNLQSLKIAFFPTCMLLVASRKWLTRVMQPLSDLPGTVSVQVSLPSLLFFRRKSGEGMPVIDGFDSGTAFYTLARPEIAYHRTLLKCGSYWEFCDLRALVGLVIPRTPTGVA